MGNQKQLTIIRPVYNKTPPGYGGFNLYLARETGPSLYGGIEIFLLTEENYATGQIFSLDYDADTVPMKNKQSDRMDGKKIYVQKTKITIPTGYFKVKHAIPATSPTDEFKNHSIDRSRFSLYEVTHVPLNGAQTGSLSRVFSEVTPPYTRGEDIEGGETRLLRKIAQNDGYNYYIHDKAMYDKRALEALFPHWKKG